MGMIRKTVSVMTVGLVDFRSDKERRLWRQSEVMLRMAQSREPNRAGRYGNGLIVAALPDVYSTPWARDMAWATVALARTSSRVSSPRWSIVVSIPRSASRRATSTASAARSPGT